MNHSILGVSLFGPLDIGIAAAISGAGIGAGGSGAGGSATEEPLESAALSSFAPVGGFPAFSASNKNVGIKKTANDAVAIVLTLSLIVVSCAARRDHRKSIAAV